MKKQLGASDAFFPIPATLVVSGSGNEANIITIVWIGIVSSTPPTIGISLYKERHSLELIMKTGEFTVNIASADLVKETDYCGMVSGKKTNKFNDTGFTPIQGTVVKSPIIKECPYNMECKVVGKMEMGDWILVLGEIVETHIDDDKIIDILHCKNGEVPVTLLPIGYTLSPKLSITRRKDLNELSREI